MNLVLVNKYHCFEPLPNDPAYFSDKNIRKEGENCGNGWYDTNSYFCGDCGEDLQCCDESNSTNSYFGCGTCQKKCIPR